MKSLGACGGITADTSISRRLQYFMIYSCVVVSHHPPREMGCHLTNLLLSSFHIVYTTYWESIKGCLCREYEHVVAVTKHEISFQRRMLLERDPQTAAQMFKRSIETQDQRKAVFESPELEQVALFLSHPIITQALKPLMPSGWMFVLLWLPRLFVIVQEQRKWPRGAIPWSLCLVTLPPPPSVVLIKGGHLSPPAIHSRMPKKAEEGKRRRGRWGYINIASKEGSMPKRST